MIAKATAREANMRFINLDVSILTDKWYGESQKLASAVFSLAVKLQPCIIFIDEIGKLIFVSYLCQGLEILSKNFQPASLICAFSLNHC